MHLVANPGTGDEQRIAFCRVLEIDRDVDGREAMPGLLLVQDPLMSRRHCVLTRSPDGRFYVRDVSLNGTRLSGRRLVPEVETEIRPGEILTAGSHDFILDAAPERGEPTPGAHRSDGLSMRCPADDARLPSAEAGLSRRVGGRPGAANLDMTGVTSLDVYAYEEDAAGDE
jgi:hypothetical protein